MTVEAQSKPAGRSARIALSSVAPTPLYVRDKVALKMHEQR